MRRNQEAAAKPLTLVDGVTRAFDPIQGMVPTQTKHAKNARRLADRAPAILGESLAWSESTLGKVQYLAGARVLGKA